MEKDAIDCFLRGLKPELEIRIGRANKFDEIVERAIRDERNLSARNELRRGNRQHSLFQETEKSLIGLIKICIAILIKTIKVEIINKIRILTEISIQIQISIEILFKAKIPIKVKASIKVKISIEAGISMKPKMKL